MELSYNVRMKSLCPRCGAQLPDTESCQNRFDLTQTKELGAPEFYQVHHLSVPCYMLQHNTYSAEGWLAVRELLKQFVFQGLSAEEARRQNREMMDTGHRTWSLRKGPKLQDVDKIRWHLTVADVRQDSAEHYCADVRRWAISVLTDSAELVDSLHSKS
ncbi:MAG: DUF5946 family protein [Anaerolineales bacterium]|jgi:hypothetical protein